MSETKTYSLTLTLKEDAALTAAALHKGHRTKSQFIRFAIEDYVKKHNLFDKEKNV